MFVDLDLFLFIATRDLVRAELPPGGPNEVTFMWRLLAEVWAERGEQLGLARHREPSCGELFLLPGPVGQGRAPKLLPKVCC